MNNLIQKIQISRKRHGLKYIIKTAPGHIFRKGRWFLYEAIFDPISLNREGLIDYSKKHGKIWFLDDGSFVEMRAPLNDKIPEEFQESLGDHEIKPNFVCEISEVTLIGPWAIPVTKENRFIKELFGPVFYNRLHQTIAETGILKFVWALLSNNIESGEVTSSRPLFYMRARHGTGPERPNYGHWLIENLPQLRTLEMYESITDTKPIILINQNPPSWLVESLQLMGYTPDDWVEWQGRTSQIERLIIPKLFFTHPYGSQLDSERRRWVRSKLKESVRYEITDTSPSRIFISRQEVMRRKICNYEEVKEELESFNFRFIEPEKYTLAEQIKLFINADIIVGLTGAGLTNILFSSDATLVEIFVKNSRFPFFFSYTNELGNGYVWMDSEEPINKQAGIPGYMNRHKNPSVNTRSLLRLLNTCCDLSVK